MKKEKKEKTKIIEVEKSATKSKKSEKKSNKLNKKMVKENIQKEKKAIEEEIDKLYLEKKANKGNKAKKKEIKQEINDLKYQRSRMGKKDTYFSDVMAEMRLVRWPSKMEVLKYSIASLIFILIFALLFFGLDRLFVLVKDWL